MRVVSIEVSCPEEIHGYDLLEIPDDWDLGKLKKEWWRGWVPGGVNRQEFAEFLKSRGAKEFKFERFDAD